MSDSWPAYSRLREESPVHYIEKYDCWALARFEDVWEALLNHEVFTAIQGVSPGQILLHEPVPPTFMTMDLPEHRRYRSLIGQDYTRKTVAGYEGKIRALTREILAPLLTAGAFDVYADLANRVATLFIGGLIGIPRDEIEPLRALVSRFFHREFEQVGTSEKNAKVGALLNQQIAAIVTRRRLRHPPSAPPLAIVRSRHSQVPGRFARIPRGAHHSRRASRGSGALPRRAQRLPPRIRRVSLRVSRGSDCLRAAQWRDRRAVTVFIGD